MQKKKIISLDEGEDPLSSMGSSTIKKNSTKEAFEKSVRELERDLLSDEFTAENKSPVVINKSINPNVAHRDDKSLFGGVDQKSGKPSVLQKAQNGSQQKGTGSSDDSGVSRRPFENSHTLKPHSNEEKMNLHRPKSMPPKPEWLKSSNMQLLPGEKLVSSVQCAIMLMQYPHLSTDGTFAMTNYRVQFIPTDPVAFSNRRPKLKEDYLWIPLAFIFKFEKSSDKKNLDVVYIDVYSKDGRIFKLKIMERQGGDSISLLQYLHIYAFPERKEQLFAFEYGKANRELEDKYKGWKIYDIEKEFKRQGVEFESLSSPGSGSNTNCAFRLVDNHNFKICSTYPPKLLIPAKVSDSTFIASSKFRSRERVPAITYYYAKTKTILARSSQSKPGIYTNRCLEDEQLLRYLGNPQLNDIGDTGVNDINLYIYDARPYLNAMATRLNGHGFEDTKWYRNCEIFFMDIDNIHHVRDNHRKLLNLCFSPETSNNKWYSQFESTNWLELISLIIGAALKVTHSLKNGKSCLVHCSDGWDRTSQILSLAQIMVDPYFRTIEGFEVLITKDWVYFGHQFNTRIGHGNKNEKDDQRSPVFLQFLDCVHQLVSQYPFAFEFNQKFLCDIAYHAYSCQFGLFLCNCYQEVLLYKLEEKTVSLWSYLNSQKDKYYNIYYNSKEDSNNPLILRPSVHLKHLRLWEEYFLNYSWLSKPQFELSENVVFTKDFYEHMLLKDRKKIKELKTEVEELKARLRKYENPDGEEEQKDSNTPAQDDDIIKIGEGDSQENEQEFKGDQPLGDQDNVNQNGEDGGEFGEREIEDSYEKIKGSNPDEE